MSALTVYGFEHAFEPAIGAIFIQNGIKAYTPEGEVQDDQTIKPAPPPLQRKRPRVDIKFTPGAETGHRHLINDSDNYNQSVPDGFQGSVLLELITDIDATTHFNFLATTRMLIPQLPRLLIPVAVNHTMHFPNRQDGEEHLYNSGDGYFLTKLKFSFVFSVNRHTWALLSAP